MQHSQKNKKRKSLIHFDLSFVSDATSGSSYMIFLSVSFSQHHLLNRLSFPCWCPCGPYMRGFISWLSNLFHWSMCLLLCYSIITILSLLLLIYNRIWNQEMFWFQLWTFIMRLFSFLSLMWFLDSMPVKNGIGILTGIALNLQMALDCMNILTTLVLPIQEHYTPFHLKDTPTFQKFALHHLTSMKHLNS